MFDIGASELLLTVIVAIVVIGPKDLPRALRLAGGWIGKVRRISGHFRSGIEEMIRQAELEEMEKKWREKNAAIMQQEPANEPASEVGAASAAAEAALPAYSVDERGEVHETAAPAPAYQASPDLVSPDVASPELPLASPKARP
jgi:sec-independent protein translocase protein TatB